MFQHFAGVGILNYLAYTVYLTFRFHTLEVIQVILQFEYFWLLQLAATQDFVQIFCKTFTRYYCSACEQVVI